MKRFTGHIAFVLATLLASFGAVYGQTAGTGISTLDPWSATTSPVSAITQRSYGRAIKITGLPTGNCLTLTASSILSTTACGSGGGVSTTTDNFWLGTNSFAGPTQLSTTTASNLNGTVYVDGVKYPKTVAGVQQAINDAYALYVTSTSSTAKVIIGPGNITSSGTSITAKSNISIQCTGTVFINTSGNTASVFRAPSYASGGLQNFTLDGCTTTGGAGWYSSGNVHYSTFSNNKFYGTSTVSGFLVFFDAYASNSDNVITHNLFSGSTGVGNWDMLGSGSLDRSEISFNRFEYGNGQGWGATSVNDTRAISNVFDQVGNPIGFEGTTTGNVVQGNFVWRSGNIKLALENAFDTSTGNIVSNNGLYYSGGIQDGNGTGDIITGNSIYGSQNKGIFGSFSHSLISNNILDNTNWGNAAISACSASHNDGGIVLENTTLSTSTIQNTENVIRGNKLYTSRASFSHPDGTTKTAWTGGIIVDSGYSNTQLDGNSEDSTYDSVVDCSSALAQMSAFRGKWGVGTSSPWKTFSINGDLSLTGGLYDSSASVGSAGFLLQSTGSATKWVATSTLGFASLSSFSASAPLSYNSSSGAFSIPPASGSANGYLSATHWTTFNGKLASSSLSGANGITFNSSTGVIGLGTVGTSNGGTGATTQVTNGVNYFDGSKITSGTGQAFSGTTLTIGNGTTGTIVLGDTSLMTKSSGSYVDFLSNGVTNISGEAIGYGSVTDTNTVFKVKANGLDSIFVPSSTGNVGIGTSTPSFPLEINRSANSTDNLALLDMKGVDTSSGRVAEIKTLLSPASARGTTIQGIENGNIMGGISFPNITGVAGGVHLLYGSTVGASLTNAGRFGIGTTSPAATLSTQGNEYTTGGLGVGVLNTVGGTIQSSGNALFGGMLGVGTTSPYAALAVQKNAAMTGLLITNPTNLSGNAFQYLDGFGDNFYIDQYASLYDSTAGFNVTPNGNVATVRIASKSTNNSPLITTGGNVGFGTSTPYAALSVQSSTSTVFAVATSTSGQIFSIRNTGITNFRPETNVANVMGDWWYDVVQSVFAFFDGFTTHYVQSTTFVATADKVVATTTPTSPFSSGVGTTTIGANTPTIGKQFEVKGSGVFTTPTGNTAFVNLAIAFLGTTTVTIDTRTTPAFPANASNYPFNFYFDCTFRSIGVSGTVVCNGKFLFETSLVTPAETPIPMAGSGTINTTINEQIVPTASWSAVTSTQSATVQESSITWLN